MGFVGFEINSIVRPDDAREGQEEERSSLSASAIFLGLLALLGVLFLFFGPPVSILSGGSDETTEIQPEIIETNASDINAQSFSTQRAPASASQSEDSDTSKPAHVESGKVNYRVQPGDTLAKIWKLHGAPQYGGMLAAKAWEDVGVPRRRASSEYCRW